MKTLDDLQEHIDVLGNVIAIKEAHRNRLDALIAWYGTAKGCPHRSKMLDHLQEHVDVRKNVNAVEEANENKLNTSIA